VKAIICESYGPPENLQIKEVAKPTPKPNEVLIKVHATAVNDYDWSMVQGKPILYRLFFGLFKPRQPIPGMEVSGVVEACGDKVSQYKLGHEVYGDTSDYGFGSFAEYLCIHEKALVRKPDFLSHQEAASLSHAGNLAWQGLIDIGGIGSGMKILINGAGGGVGTMALQIAKTYNVEVSGVDTGEKLKMMETIGFDHVIDYKQIDFTKSGERYDLILDAKTTRSPSAYMRALNPNAKYVTVGGNVTKLIRLLFARLFGNKRVQIVALKANKDLNEIEKLVKSGQLKPVIDGPYPLRGAHDAIRRFGDGKHSGKVIVCP
jgi:NADPH:quinone reductase-like Zn-dependent oxidoreductase